MRYELQIFPDSPTLPVPEVGDRFIVSKIVENVLDVHYGRCIVVELEPEVIGTENDRNRINDLVERLRIRSEIQDRFMNVDKEVRS